ERTIAHQQNSEQGGSVGRGSTEVQWSYLSVGSSRSRHADTGRAVDLLRNEKHRKDKQHQHQHQHAAAPGTPIDGPPPPPRTSHTTPTAIFLLAPKLPRSHSPPCPLLLPSPTNNNNHCQPSN
ncbi:hypothetical protein CPAR01_02591, partial [Colletotrichum paranaense]